MTAAMEDAAGSTDGPTPGLRAPLAVAGGHDVDLFVRGEHAACERMFADAGWRRLLLPGGEPPGGPFPHLGFDRGKGALQRVNMRTVPPHARGVLARLRDGRRPVPATGGLCVAFVGSDGAGKSTVVQAVTSWLSAHLRVARVYLGSGQGSSSLLRWPLLVAHRLSASRLTGRRGAAGAGADASGADESGADESGAVPARRGLRERFRPLWALVLALEKRGKLRAVFRARQRGAIVLCDRWPQNEILGFNDGPLLGAWQQSPSRWRRALARWERVPYRWAEMHPPDLVVKLVASEAVALRRKPDMSRAEVARRIAAVRALRFGRPARTLVVDADAPLADVLQIVESAIWEEL
jgi:hypothetical protein